MKRLNLILIILAILTSCGTTTYIIRKETTYGRIIIYNDRGDTTEVYPYAKLQEDTKTTCITSTGVAIPQSETTDSPLKIGGGFKFYDMNKESYVILSPAIPYKAEYKYTEVKIDSEKVAIISSARRLNFARSSCDKILLLYWRSDNIYS